MQVEHAPGLGGRGDFFAVVGSEATYFQGAYISDYDLHMELSKMAAARPRLLAQPYSPRPRLEREAQTDTKTFRWRDGVVDIDDDVDTDGKDK